MGWFGKKEIARASAELLEDGREISLQAMKSVKYNEYHGKEPKFEMRVRVLPDYEVPWEATMKAPLGCCFLLLPGVVVNVRFEADKKDEVELDDDVQSIVDRNPQLIRTP